MCVPLGVHQRVCMLSVVEALVIAVVSATGEFVFWFALLLTVQTSVIERDGAEISCPYIVNSIVNFSLLRLSIDTELLANYLLVV